MHVIIFINAPSRAHCCCTFACSSSLLRLCVLIIFVVPLCAHHLHCAVARSTSSALLRAHISVITIGGALEHDFNVDASASYNLSNDIPLSV
jgi:hypothetical protein